MDRKFVSNFFPLLCLFFEIKEVTTIAYHLQTNGKIEQYNRSLAMGQPQYVSEHQRNWDMYVQLLAYVYNTQMHRATRTSSFNGVLPQESQSAATLYVYPERLLICLRMIYPDI